MTISDWTYEETINPPSQLQIKYSKANGDPATVTLQSTTWSKVTTEYETIVYRDRDDKQQSQDVVVSRNSENRNTVAAVNGTYVSWRLSNQQSLPSGDATRTSTTTYAYIVTVEGPLLVEEATEEWITGYEFAGSLNITDYTGFQPPATKILASRTVVKYQHMILPNGRSWNQTSTTRFMALGLTQEGQQSAAEQLGLESGTGAVTAEVFWSMTTIVCDGTEVRSSIGRAQLPSRPAGQEIVNDYLQDKDQRDEQLSNSFLGSGDYSASWSFTPDSEPVSQRFNFDPAPLPEDPGDPSPALTFTETKIDTYTMPYVPDSYVDPGTGQVVDSGRAEAAKRYGEVMNSLKAGAAFGFNITTSADRLPSQPFAALYVNAAGMSVATRLNGTSWAFDQSGIVASSDLMLCGVAGALTPMASSWVRLPVKPENLPILTPPEL
jgi:hypothetical protein